MLTDAKTAKTVPVVDLERAKALYTEKLDLKTSQDLPGGKYSFNQGE